MQLIDITSGLAAIKEPVFITVGFFDGVHRGHQLLLKQLQEVAKQHNARPLVITFGNSPRTYHRPAETTRYLTLPWEKALLLQRRP